MNPEHRELRFLGTVESVFWISGRGTVIVPVWLSDLKVRVGDAVQLKASDGKTIVTHIKSLELMKNLKGSCEAGFMLPLDVERKEVAAGMEIWI